MTLALKTYQAEVNFWHDEWHFSDGPVMNVHRPDILPWTHQEFLEDACARAGVPVPQFRLNPDPESGMSTCWEPHFDAETGIIELSQFASNFVIIHETAHHLCNFLVGRVFHNRPWVEMYAELVDHYRAPGTGDRLKAHLTHAKNVKPLPVPFVEYQAREKAIDEAFGLCND